MRRFRSTYGASPAHLLGQLAVLAVATYAMSRVLRGNGAIDYLLWFLGGAILHDLLVLPLYTAADGVLRFFSVPATIQWGPRAIPGEHGVPLINHIRIPLGISAVLLLCFFPLILGNAEPNLVRSSGRSTDGYAEAWIAISAAMLAGSLLLYRFRIGRRANSSTAPPTPM